MLVARRGLGPAEVRLIAPAFARAVRWALFAEKLAPDLRPLRQGVATDPPEELTGSRRMEFIANRKLMRADLERLEATLFPPD